MGSPGQQTKTCPGKLRRQVLNWMIACAMVPLLVMALQGYHCARSAVMNLETTHLRSVLEARKARITDWFKERKADLRAVSAFPCVRQGCVGSDQLTSGKDNNDYCHLLEHIRASNRAFESLIAYDTSWRQIAATKGNDHDNAELAPSEFRARLEKATDIVVAPLHRHQSGQIGIHLGAPMITQEGKTAGYVIAATLLSETLYPILEDNSGLRASTKTYIVSANGQFFSGPRPHIEVLSRGIDYPEGFLAGSMSGAMTYRDCCGAKVLGMASSMPELGWILVAEVEKSEAFAWLQTLRVRALITGIVVFIAVLLFGINGSHLVARPFHELQAVAQRIAEGKHAERAPPMGSAEADAVGRTLNVMLDELAVHAQQLANAGALAAVGQLSSSIVHEMRNPLSSIKLNLTAIRDSFAEGSDDRELADIALREASRVEGMLNDLLAYGKPLDLAISTAPLSGILRRVNEHAAAACRECGIQLVIKWNGNEDSALAVDEELILRALENLTDNAVTFAPEGSTVVLAITVPEDVPGLLEITVSDEGPGIPADSTEKVFEPFFTTRERGTGLGLANVRKIIECHGGTVSAANHSEGGAVFMVRLPRAQELQ